MEVEERLFTYTSLHGHALVSERKSLGKDQSCSGKERGLRKECSSNKIFIFYSTSIFQLFSHMDFFFFFKDRKFKISTNASAIEPRSPCKAASRVILKGCCSRSARRKSHRTDSNLPEMQGHQARPTGGTFHSQVTACTSAPRGAGAALPDFSERLGGLSAALVQKPPSQPSAAYQAGQPAGAPGKNRLLPAPSALGLPRAVRSFLHRRPQTAEPSCPQRANNHRHGRHRSRWPGPRSSVRSSWEEKSSEHR